MTLRAWSTVPQRFETKANRCSAAGCASTSFRTRRTSSSPDTSLGVEDIASTCCASTCWRAPTAAAPPLRTDRAAGRIRGSRGRNRPFGMERRHVEGASCVQRRAAIVRLVPRVQVQGGDGQRKRGGKLGVTFEVGFEGGFYLVDPPCGRCTGGACARNTGREARPVRRVVHLLASLTRCRDLPKGGVPMRVMEGVLRARHAGSHHRLRCGRARGRLTAQPTLPICRVQRKACMLQVLARARLRRRSGNGKAAWSGGYLVSVDDVKKKRRS